jgi:transcriptional regulator with XRE-family HTH domain
MSYLKRQTIKDIVIEKYGSINNFVEKNYLRLQTSRTHIYKLLNGEDVNPTVNTLLKLADLLEVSPQEVFNEYSVRHRDKRPESEHND